MASIGATFHEVFFFLNAADNGGGAEVGGAGECLNGGLKVREWLAESVQQCNCKEMVIIDRTHSDNAAVYVADLRDCLAERGTLDELDVEHFLYEENLGERSKVFVTRSQFCEDFEAGFKISDERSIDRGNGFQQKTFERLIVVEPDVIRFRSKSLIGARNDPPEKEAKALPHGECFGMETPLLPVGFGDV